MNEKDIREYSRTLLDAFNDLTGNSINPNLDDFLKIRERSIFELNSFHKNNQKTNRVSENVENVENVNDNKIVNSNINQNQNVDKDVNINVNKNDDLKEQNKLLSTVKTSTSTSTSTLKTKDKPTSIQNKHQNVDNKQIKIEREINQEPKHIVKNEVSNNNVIAGEIKETVELDFGDDGDNFDVSEKKSAFDILKGLKDQWN